MGSAMMGTGEASGERRALLSAEAAIANPLIYDVSMRGARGLLISITGGRDLTLFEVDQAASRIREEVDPDANIIVGAPARSPCACCMLPIQPYAAARSLCHEALLGSDFARRSMMESLSRWEVNAPARSPCACCTLPIHSPPKKPTAWFAHTCRLRIDQAAT
jgi:hypothetical protein